MTVFALTSAGTTCSTKQNRSIEERAPSRQGGSPPGNHDFGRASTNLNTLPSCARHVPWTSGRWLTHSQSKRSPSLDFKFAWPWLMCRRWIF